MSRALSRLVIISATGILVPRLDAPLALAARHPFQSHRLSSDSATVSTTRESFPVAELTNFWNAVHESGVSVAVANRTSDKLLGVRDGVRRYFHDGPLSQDIDVAVRCESDEDLDYALPLSDAATASLALERARLLCAQVGSRYNFSVCCEGGLHTVEVRSGEETEIRSFTQIWTAVCGLGREALGASSCLELPPELIDGHTTTPRRLRARQTPGTRRGGGVAGSLTGGLETQRSGVAAATTNALASLMYGLVDSRSIQDR